MPIAVHCAAYFRSAGCGGMPEAKTVNASKIKGSVVQMIAAAQRRFGTVMLERDTADLRKAGITQPYRSCIRTQVKFNPCCNIRILLHLEHRFIVRHRSGQLGLESGRVRLIAARLPACQSDINAPLRIRFGIEAELVESAFSQRYNSLRLDGVRISAGAADVHLQEILTADRFKARCCGSSCFLVQYPMRRIRNAHAGIPFLLLGVAAVVNEVAVFGWSKRALR